MVADMDFARAVEAEYSRPAKRLSRCEKWGKLMRFDFLASILNPFCGPALGIKSP